MNGVLFSAIQDIPIMAIVALGFYISLRLMRFPDLSVDASYMFGMSAVGFIVGNQYGNEMLALPLAVLFGALVGVITGSLHTSKLFGLNKLLSGLLVSFAAYSICFRLIGQKASLSLYPFKGDFVVYSIIGNGDYQALASLVLVAMIYLVVVKLMNTSFGYGIRSVGHRREIIQAVGLQPNRLIIAGLAVSNGLVATAGWLSATNTTNVPLQNFGMVVHALAAVLIGEFAMFVLLWLIGKRGSAPMRASRALYLIMAVPLLGAIIYSFVRALVISVLSGQLKIAVTTDFQLVLALVVLLTVALGRKVTGVKDGGNDDTL